MVSLLPIDVRKQILTYLSIDERLEVLYPDVYPKYKTINREIRSKKDKIIRCLTFDYNRYWDANNEEYLIWLETNIYIWMNYEKCLDHYLNMVYDDFARHYVYRYSRQLNNATLMEYLSILDINTPKGRIAYIMDSLTIRQISRMFTFISYGSPFNYRIVL